MWWGEGRGGSCWARTIGPRLAAMFYVSDVLLWQEPDTYQIRYFNTYPSLGLWAFGQDGSIDMGGPGSRVGVGFRLNRFPDFA